MPPSLPLVRPRFPRLTRPAARRTLWRAAASNLPKMRTHSGPLAVAIVGLALVAPAAAPAAEPGAAGKRAMTYTKPSDEELRTRLTREQYEVTQHEATEPPFRNEYWDNKTQGLYVDVVTGEPLFSSLDKFDSGTGWPSFTRPLEQGNIVQHEDRKLFMRRTEVRSKHGGSHLGHVFDDGPAPTGQRYCINSAALRFVPVEKLEEEGYGDYLPLFRKAAPEK